MGALRLGDLAVRLGLGRMDEVRELDPVLDEEDGDVVADEVPVALVGVELHGEPPDVPGSVRRAARSEHRREAHEGPRDGARVGEDACARDLGQRLVELEAPMGTGPPSVHHPLGDPLVIEVGDLLPQVVVLEERGSARVGPQGVVGVLHRGALAGGDGGAGLSP